MAKQADVTILQDAALRPPLFVWIGPCRPGVLEQWMADQALGVPDDLVAFWRVTGGGVAFETEELLPPVGSADLADSIQARNEWHRSQGMPAGFLLFHEGAWLSAVRAIEPQYVTLMPAGYIVEEEYSSLAEWYCRTLRAEYAERYGLASPQPGAPSNKPVQPTRDKAARG